MLFCGPLTWIIISQQKIHTCQLSAENSTFLGPFPKGRPGVATLFLGVKEFSQVGMNHNIPLASCQAAVTGLLHLVVQLQPVGLFNNKLHGPVKHTGKSITEQLLKKSHDM